MKEKGLWLKKEGDKEGDQKEDDKEDNNMPFVLMRRFLLGTGAEPANCQVDNATKVIAEILLQTEYGPGVNEEVNVVVLNISKADTNEAVKCFKYEGACALRAGVTYTIQTPMFTLPTGKYQIFTGFIGNPLTRPLGECGISMKEVTC